MSAAEWRPGGTVQVLYPSGEVVATDYRRGVSLLSRGLAVPYDEPPAPEPKRHKPLSDVSTAGVEVDVQDGEVAEDVPLSGEEPVSDEWR